MAVLRANATVGRRTKWCIRQAEDKLSRRQLAAYLAHKTGHRAGIETVRVHLHKAGYVCKRPTWTLQCKAAEQPEWAKNA